MFCNTLTLENIWLQHVSDKCDFTNFVNKCALDNSIKECVFRNTRLCLNRTQFYDVLQSVSSMTSLTAVSIQEWKDEPLRLAELIFSVLNLPAMQGLAFDYAFKLECSGLIKEIEPIKQTSELCFSSNSIDDKFLLDISIKKDHFLCKNPVEGVEELVLSNNPLTDEAFKYLVVLFPSLKKLHLSRCTGIKASKIEKILNGYFPKLELLNLDGTSLCQDALVGLHNVMKERWRVASSPSLEVWLRGVGIPDDSWGPLLTFCSNKGRNGKFTVKHDLQRFVATNNVYIEQCHEMVYVSVFFPGFAPIHIIQSDVMATHSCATFVNRVLRDLRMMSTAELDQSSSVKIRKEYRDAFQHLLDGGILGMHKLKAESAFMIKKNSYFYNRVIEEVDAIGTPKEYSVWIGPPVPGVSVSFEIVICYDD